MHRRNLTPSARPAVGGAVGPRELSRSRATALFAPVLALIVLCLAAVAAYALQFPQLTGRVVDNAHILDMMTSATIEQKLKDLEDKSGIQLVVATVPSLEGTDIATYGVELGRAWKIGQDKKNNGLILLVAPNERKVRIEVGYGLEGVMTDALSSVIIQSAILPKFRTGDYAGGVSAGVDAIIDALTVDQSEWQQKAQVRVDQQPSLLDQLLPFLMLALFLFIFFQMARASRGSNGRWVNRGGNVIFLPTPGGFGGGYGGGFGGGGGFDGGFSGGGGDFGGGGASGSW
ncbi:MAG: TPM domain-containing protein [Hyphomicrobiales bacterium]|nr:TPM domain-containing protein [Hyphomicrobiales bacterium]